jgi:hypothetical protein
MVLVKSKKNITSITKFVFFLGWQTPPSIISFPIKKSDTAISDYHIVVSPSIFQWIILIKGLVSFDAIWGYISFSEPMSSLFLRPIGGSIFILAKVLKLHRKISNVTISFRGWTLHQHALQVNMHWKPRFQSLEAQAKPSFSRPRVHFATSLGIPRPLETTELRHANHWQVDGFSMF